MKSAGATTALTLDGGGSSGMYLNKFGLMNTPSDGHERAVSNGIFAVDLSASDDVIAEILPYEKTVMLPVYGSYTPVIYGYNQYGTLINLGLKNVTYSCEKEVGTVREDGSFFANGSRDGILKVKWNQLETSIHIKYLKEEEISLRLDSVIIDGYTGYPVELNARIGDKEYPLAPYALEWSIDNPTICSINDGIVTGLKNGEKMCIRDRRYIPVYTLVHFYNILNLYIHEVFIPVSYTHLAHFFQVDKVVLLKNIVIGKL